MATKLRAAIADTGPDGGSAWYDGGESIAFAAISATTTATILPVSIVPTVDLQAAGGATPMDSLIGSAGTSTGPQPIQRLNGGQVALVTILAAAANLNFYLRVMRSIDELASQITNAGGALTSIPLSAPLSTPIVSGGTFVLTNAAGTAQTWTTSAAVAAGALAIPVNSQTPSATFAAGVDLVYQVGNQGLFGWLVSGTGTPVFPAGEAIPLPAITANPMVITPGNSGSYVNLFPADFIQLVVQTGSSTASVPLGAVSTLIA